MSTYDDIIRVFMIMSIFFVSLSSFKSINTIDDVSKQDPN